MSDATPRQALDAYAEKLWVQHADRRLAYTALCDAFYTAEEIQPAVDDFVWECVQVGLSRLIEKAASAGRTGGAQSLRLRWTICATASLFVALQKTP
jgi:hypothetical protein